MDFSKLISTRLGVNGLAIGAIYALSSNPATFPFAVLIGAGAAVYTICNTIRPSGNGAPPEAAPAAE
jgi:hypothetical protein